MNTIYTYRLDSIPFSIVVHSIHAKILFNKHMNKNIYIKRCRRSSSNVSIIDLPWIHILLIWRRRLHTYKDAKQIHHQTILLLRFFRSNHQQIKYIQLHFLHDFIQINITLFKGFIENKKISVCWKHKKAASFNGIEKWIKW